MSSSYDVVALRYATATTSREQSFYRHHAYGEVDEAIEIDFFYWVVTDGDEVILVDTGFQEGVGVRRGRTCLMEPVAGLSRLGIGAGDVSSVIVTHLHYDHVGNLSAFPNATIVVQRRELDFWTGPFADRFHFAQVVEHNEIDFFSRLASEGRLRIVEGNTELQAGVGLQLVGGHCPGQQVVAVAGPRRQIVLASDALHFYEEMEQDRPFSLFTDLPEMYAAYATLRDLEARGATIVAGHDPLVMSRFPPLEDRDGEFGVRVE